MKNPSSVNPNFGHVPKHSDAEKSQEEETPKLNPFAFREAD